MAIEWHDLPYELRLEAARWEVEFSEGENPPPELYAQFQEWLAADPQHPVAFQLCQEFAASVVDDGVRLGLRKAPSRPS